MYWRKIFIILVLVTKFFGSDLIILPKFEQNIEENLDFKLLNAIYDEAQNPKNSITIYVDLYDKTGDKEILLRAIKLAYLGNFQDELGALLLKGEAVLEQNSDFVRVKSVSLINQKQYLQANWLMDDLIKNDDKDSRNYVILATTYYYLKNYQLSYENFKKAYELEPSEENLLKLCEVLVTYLKRDKEALRYLNFHAKISGFSEPIIQGIYTINLRNRDFININKLYFELYKRTKDTKYLTSALQIYLYEKNYDQAINLLETYNFDSKTLIELYGFKKEFRKAYELSLKEFEITKNPEFASIAAIYLYELNEPKIDSKIMQKITGLFENSVYELNDDNYYNYYGYILIDYDIDVNKGIDLVQKALGINPDFAHYIDSLAWGYYKLGNCVKAQEEISKIKTNLDKTINEHIEIINSCKSEKNADKN